MTIDADTIRAAAHDARALLDLLETLTGGSVYLYRAHKQSGPPGHRQYEMYDSEIEVNADGALVSNSDAYALLGEITTACLRRGWIARVDIEPLYSEAFVWDDPDDNALGTQIVDASDTLPPEHAPALALLASYLLAVLATRNDA